MLLNQSNLGVYYKCPNLNLKMEMERKERDTGNGNHELLLIKVSTVSFIFLLKIIYSAFHIPNFSQGISVHWLFGIWKYTLNLVVPFIVKKPVTVLAKTFVIVHNVKAFGLLGYLCSCYVSISYQTCDLDHGT